MKIFGFYHILCKNNYTDLIRNQLLNIKTSGLIYKTDMLFMSVIGNNTAIRKIGDIVNELELNNVFIIDNGTDEKQYEYVTLEKIKEMSNNTEFYCYYIHTKGISKEYSEFSEKWRKYMEFFIIENHEICIKHLNNVDTIGVHYLTRPPHYRGNFWWSKSSHIKKLEEITEEQKKERWYAEFWICSKECKHLSLHTPTIQDPIWRCDIGDSYRNSKTWNV